MESKLVLDASVGLPAAGNLLEPRRHMRFEQAQRIYSSRSTCIGSTRVARCAGTQQATLADFVHTNGWGFSLYVSMYGGKHHLCSNRHPEAPLVRCS